jgi:hypothetical protein
MAPERNIPREKKKDCDCRSENHGGDRKKACTKYLRHSDTPSHELNKGITMQRGQETKVKRRVYVVLYSRDLHEWEEKQVRGDVTDHGGDLVGVEKGRLWETMLRKVSYCSYPFEGGDNQKDGRFWSGNSTIALQCVRKRTNGPRYGNIAAVGTKMHKYVLCFPCRR